MTSLEAHESRRWGNQNKHKHNTTTRPQYTNAQVVGQWLICRDIQSIPGFEMTSVSISKTRTAGSLPVRCQNTRTQQTRPTSVRASPGGESKSWTPVEDETCRRSALFAAVSLCAGAILPQSAVASSVAERSSLVVDIEQGLRRPLEELRELEKEEAKVREEDPLLLQTVAVSEAFAFVGALVGGLAARQRGIALAEREVVLKETVDKLRKVNQEVELERRMFARQVAQTRVETQKETQEEMASDCVIPAEPEGAEYSEVRRILKAGRQALSDGNAMEAHAHFTKAYQQASASDGDPEQAWKASRGLAATAQLTGNLAQAVKHMELCLERSVTESERCHAYGVLADLHTELDDLDQAGKFYDLYLDAIHHD
ncbi:hypothetical protein CYMTET_6081 [Cymbomonas tetramitiformis]|uniref:Uncharacterized protein n=1 Tax=Cymbomonas tetramitiformis TaxID=36881 RepID=A0AAE0GXV0_9CHLO|nr:hypothetical protein CYMTET_6081 [Cymbomonas tetramitiformis]